MIKFYDTCSLLELQEAIFEDKEKFLISNITTKELQEIEHAFNKDEEIKYKARCLIRLLNDPENQSKYETILYHKSLDDFIYNEDLYPNNDSKIIASAYEYQRTNNIEVLFISADGGCRKAAQDIGLQTNCPELEIEDSYTGVMELVLSEIELADFYTHCVDNKNVYNLYENQYIIIKDESGKVIDKYKWKDNHYQQIMFQKSESVYFGKVVPKDGDAYQQLALDSLHTNKITMLRGAAGSGKSYLAFAHMFSLLEHHEVDKIIIFCNTVATKGSAKLGFYPGSRTEKLLDSQIGNLLESKLGGRIAVERLIADEQLVLLPMSDIRGYDTTGMNAAIYISEAQNMDIELMRLALQRIGEDSICIIDGDDRAQVDMPLYAGSHNGMKRVSKVFRGASFYGEVTLQNIYRSEIAKLAQKL